MTQGNGKQTIPPSLALAWGLQPRPGRGPKPGLTLPGVVQAGITLARRDGLGAVSMARVAKELGASTMALYRYVPSKDALLTLMVDAALGPAPGAHLPADGWRAGLQRWADALQAAYRGNVWTLRVPISGPPIAPNNIAWLEDGLRCLADTPLDEGHKLSTMLLVSGFVRSEETLLADMAVAAGGELVMPGYGAMLLSLTSEAEFPALHRAIASGSLDEDDDLQKEYDVGLARILDGVEALIARAGP
jgi:AcrR family transcriptional regulator